MIHSHTCNSTNRTNLAKLNPVDVEIADLTEIVIKQETAANDCKDVTTPVHILDLYV